MGLRNRQRFINVYHKNTAVERKLARIMTAVCAQSAEPVEAHRTVMSNLQVEGHLACGLNFRLPMGFMPKAFRKCLSHLEKCNIDTQMDKTSFALGLSKAAARQCALLPHTRLFPKLV